MKATMTPDTLPPSHVRLLEAVHTNGLTDEQRRVIVPLVDAILEETTRRRRVLKIIQDTLSTLRLDMKYLVFDNQALTRERDEARKRAL
jgi:hypothetical protein